MEMVIYRYFIATQQDEQLKAQEAALQEQKAKLEALEAKLNAILNK
jgi:hypothetical protein